jgi:hypothetical protein
MDLAELLNRDCHCISVDRRALEDSMNPGLEELVSLAESHPHLFAASPVFVAHRHVETMGEVVQLLARLPRLEGYRDWALSGAPEVAAADTGPRGVFFGFDFHLAEDGPRLIEVNTNAGGALLCLHLARAQRACCDAVAPLTVGGADAEQIEGRWLETFREEWDHFGASRELRSVAIVDQDPRAQFLYPEMQLFRRLFEDAGLRCEVLDPRELRWDGERLRTANGTVDLVYNRLTDFYLQETTSAALRDAYEARAVAVTPNPHVYALLADKRNLLAFSDDTLLATWGLDDRGREILRRTVPETRLVRPQDADELWSRRKELFFKPRTSHGSRGAFDGGKLTRKTFASILEGSYVAQRKVPPAERTLWVDGEERRLKVDLRCVAYAGEVQLISARLYRGQTTNMRTEGGGLATVFTVPAPASLPDAGAGPGA